MSLVRVTPRNRNQLTAGVAALEHRATYPLGDDFFKIDHGEDYFAFFNRLGTAEYYAWLEKGEVVAVACAVLRKIRISPSKMLRTWYLCDLKVHPNFRRHGIPLRMLRRGFFPAYLRCSRGYAISMNAPGATENRVARLLSHFRWAPLRASMTLQIWHLDSNQMLRAKTVIEKYRGPISFLSLRGVKDIVLLSTNEALALRHVQFGPLAQHSAETEIQGGVTYMFCAPVGDVMGATLRDLGLDPTSEATVIQHRMNSFDWSWILTSDI